MIQIVCNRCKKVITEGDVGYVSIGTKNKGSKKPIGDYANWDFCHECTSVIIAIITNDETEEITEENK